MLARIDSVNLSTSNGITELITQETDNNGNKDLNGNKDTIHVYKTHFEELDLSKAYYRSKIGMDFGKLIHYLSLGHPPHS